MQLPCNTCASSAACADGFPTTSLGVQAAALGGEPIPAMNKPLDKIVWHALCGAQAWCAAGTRGTRRLRYRFASPFGESAWLRTNSPN
jgi:hypothetical protein